MKSLGDNDNEKKKEVIRVKIIDYIALILVLVGAINWGLVGFFSFDLVCVIFGDMTLISRIIYALIGIAGLYALSFFGRLGRTTEETD